jgi:hypothetical protein
MQDFYMDGGLPADDLQTQPTNPLDILASRPTFSNVLGSNTLAVPLSAAEQTKSMESIQEVFELEEDSPKEDEEMGEGDAEEPEVDLEDQQRRTDRLKGVLETLGQLWWSNSEHMDVAAEKLADGSRDRTSILF